MLKVSKAIRILFKSRFKRLFDQQKYKTKCEKRKNRCDT